MFHWILLIILFVCVMSIKNVDFDKDENHKPVHILGKEYLIKGIKW